MSKTLPVPLLFPLLFLLLFPAPAACDSQLASAVTRLGKRVRVLERAVSAYDAQSRAAGHTIRALLLQNSAIAAALDVDPVRATNAMRPTNVSELHRGNVGLRIEDCGFPIRFKTPRDVVCSPLDPGDDDFRLVEECCWRFAVLSALTDALRGAAAPSRA